MAIILIILFFSGTCFAGNEFRVTVDVQVNKQFERFKVNIPKEILNHGWNVTLESTSEMGRTVSWGAPNQKEFSLRVPKVPAKVKVALLVRPNKSGTPAGRGVIEDLFKAGALKFEIKKQDSSLNFKRMQFLSSNNPTVRIDTYAPRGFATGHLEYLPHWNLGQGFRIPDESRGWRETQWSAWLAKQIGGIAEAKTYTDQRVDILVPTKDSQRGVAIEVGWAKLSVADQDIGQAISYAHMTYTDPAIIWLSDDGPRAKIAIRYMQAKCQQKQIKLYIQRVHKEIDP